MSVVLKFGGTSVASAATLEQVRTIVAQEHDLSGGLVCVVSATAGTTNALLQLAHASALPSTDVAAQCEAIRARHLTIADELVPVSHRASARECITTLVAELQRYCESMRTLEECTPASLDAVASMGERLSSTLLTHALQATGVDCVEVRATNVIHTDSTFMQAKVDPVRTHDAASSFVVPHLTANRVVVTQGFTGSDAEGRTTTLGRGGSDASAAIIGAAIGATRIEIWTDVSGVFSADPRLVPSARPIASLSFAEIRELALYGAKVLHPDTILPAVEHDIPVLVKNTFTPADPGTVILAQPVSHGALHAVSLMRPCCVVSGSHDEVQGVASLDHLRTHLLVTGSSREHGIAVIHTPDAKHATDVAVAVTGTTLTMEQCAVVICTGPDASRVDTTSNIVSRLAHLDVHGILTGVSPYSCFVVVAESDAVEALQGLHELV